jgi:hypothetical protein
MFSAIAIVSCAIHCCRSRARGNRRANVTGTHLALPKPMRPEPIIVLIAGIVGGCASTTSHQPALEPALAPASAPTAQQPTAEPRSEPRQDTSAKNKPGPWEFTVGGAGASNDDFDAGGAQASASVGYYFNEVIELVVRQNGTFSDAGEGSPDLWNGASRAALDVHIPLGPVVPFVGGQVGYVYGDGVRDSMLAGPEAGVKIYLKDDAFLLVSAEYQFFFDRGDSLNTAFDDGQLLYGLSIGLRF